MRLRYGYIIRCVGADKDAAGNVTAVHCTYDPETRSGTPGAERAQGQGQHPLAVGRARASRPRCGSTIGCSPCRFPGARNPHGARVEAEAAAVVAGHAPVVAGEDDDEPADAVERNYLDDLNPESKRVITAFVEPALAAARAGGRGSSSSGTATSSPISRTTRRDSPCSTAR